MPLTFEPTIVYRKLSVHSGAIALLLVLVAGLIDLRKPFTGDQALFVTGARALSRGAMLYRDFWDLKQPGIYGFYWLGLHLPGSPEVAVHALELIYFLAFTSVILLTLRCCSYSPIYSALSAVLVCGVYFVISGNWHLTQVEGLVGFPLYVCAWWLLAPARSARLPAGRIVFAGIAAGIVVLFKLMLILIPLSFFALLILRERQNNRSLLSCVLAIVLFGLGLIIPLFPVLYFFAAHDELNLLYATWIESPMRITRELPHNSLSVLRVGFVWFIVRLGLLLALACVGVLDRKKDWFTRGMVLWIIAGLGLIMLQRMGWEYHFLLLICPIGILAAAGTQAFFQSETNGATQPAGRLPAKIPLVLISAYAAFGIAKAVAQLRDPRPAFYGQVAQNAAIATVPVVPPGSIYVLGDPLIYYLTDREQAVAINGWSPEWLLDDQWRDLATQLRLKRPVDIFVARENDKLLDIRGQAFTQVLKDEYRKTQDAPTGAWYQLNPPK